MNAIGIGLVVALGTVVGTFIDYPAAPAARVIVFGLFNGLFIATAWVVSVSALEFFGLRPRRR